ncbi:efflux RND transporter periplasmic adaptor subunit [Roseomonas sp. SSH11]|uniref:Efflux RND transporter periplasmic adaptor subunit n=1 Tax=Pararoseomonas baculiformis TaxID=2820812 RepID=A0ABS4AAW2_9PROT|nr:efflux RND transporter periplasmic adaptor subunit [Pararoseomonas baculiformis]MBP0443996.1 efflux RND transporter periplasmic adaptor subunit [Pararoseomonas baculiformis]
MRTRTQLLVLAVLAGGGAAWHFYGEQAGLPRPLALLGLERRDVAATAGAAGPVNVAVAPVRQGRVIERAESVGTVRAREAVTITAKNTGIVTAIRFQEGQRVAAGDVLLVMDDAALRAELDQARAQLDDARSQLQRVQRLTAGVVAEQRVDTLQAAARAAEGRVRQMQARLDEARLTAPFAGRVGLRSVSAGALVQPGTAVTTLDDISRVRVEFSIPEVHVARVQAGSIVKARSNAYGERRFQGTVTVADTRIDPGTRTVRLVSEFDNADEALRPGLFLTIELDLATRNDALLVPEEALDPVGERAFVFVVRDNRAQRVEVTLGQRLSGEVEVLRGVSANDMVVVRGIQRLRNNAQVRVTETMTRPTS